MNKKRGFTIIEIIISVALISVVMLFLFQLLTDVEFEATHPTYAKENQVVRASVMRSVQQDLSNMPLKSIDSTNKQRIKFIYQDGTTPLEKVLTISDSAISYGSEEAWELQGQDVKIDTDNIQVKIVGNDPSLCTDIQNQELQITEQHCPNYQYVKIVIPITNGNEDNVIDDIELFYIGEATVFEPDQSLRTYFLKFNNDAGSTIQVNRISTTQSAIASTGIINESNEIYPGDQLRIMISPKTNYVIDEYSVEGYPEFRSGDTVNVNQNIIIESKSHVPEYSLKVENGAGTSIVINRTFSEVGRTGVIHQGDKIYQGDKLLISVTTNTSAYNTPTLKANNTTITSGTEYIVNQPTENQLVVSSNATVREYTLTKSQGTGTTLTIQRTSSPIGKGIIGVLENNAKIYYNDVLKVTVSAQTGYKDAKIMAGGSELVSGGTKTVTGNLTISSSASIITYTVTFNDNGGSGGPGTQTKNYNQNLTLSSSKPIRAGYDFKNWNTQANGKGTSYNSGATYSANAALSLYAQWTQTTYQVTYNANGGSGGPSTQTKYYGTNLTLSSSKPKRTGYTFKNWNTQANGKGTSYNSGATYSANAALSLYAQWSPITYTVTFKDNGGSGGPGTQTKYYGTNLKLSTTKPTKKGFTFKNWNTKENGRGTTYNPGDNYSTNAALTLYAQWNKSDTIRPVVTCKAPTSVRSGSISFSNSNFSYSDEGGSGIKSVEYRVKGMSSFQAFPGSITTSSSYIDILVTDYSGNSRSVRCDTGVDNTPPNTLALDIDRTSQDSGIISATCVRNYLYTDSDNECTITVNRNRRFLYYTQGVYDATDNRYCFDQDVSIGCAGIKYYTEEIYKLDGSLYYSQIAYAGGSYSSISYYSNHTRIQTVTDNVGNVSKRLIVHVVFQ